MRIRVGGTAPTGAGIIATLLLSACGGGGGVSSTPTPSSTTTTAATTTTSSTTTTSTTTATTPAVIPTPSTTNVGNINYDDSEYRLSNGAVGINALAAYSRGATGQGVKIAVIDSGISDRTGQFTGRIDPASTDLVSNRGLADPAGHGTSVAAIAAAGRNGTSMMGVAFNATILMARTDTVGTCGSAEGCKHNDNNIARGVDLARNNGARVINISLGGAAANSAMIAAVRNAVAAGIVVVMAGGNGGSADPDIFAQIAAQPEMNGMVIIAGSSDADGRASTYSSKAGTFAPYYLTAIGEKIRSFDQFGDEYNYTGTSYSAPVIAGAVALLAQAFPNLTGKQIVDLLYATATDGGDPGTDPIYGRGVLNLTKAFQPQGTTSLAGSGTTISTANNATLGSAMGDASQGGMAASVEALFLDGYGRAYTMNLGATIDRQPGARPLIGALSGDIRATSLAQGRFALSLNIGRDRAAMAGDLAGLNLNRRDARLVRMISGRVLAQIDPKTQAVFGFSEGAGRLSAMLDGRADLPFVAARESDTTPGFAQRDGHAFAIRRELGFAGMTVAGESGRVWTGALRPGLASRADLGLYQQASVRFDRRLGHVALSGGLGLLRENDSVLGSRFGGALGGGGATTRLVDMRAQWDMGSGWALAGAVRQGWTVADTGSVLTRGRLSSNAFSVDLGQTGMKHRFGLRIAQPMRVETGRFLLNLPSSYDYATGEVGYAQRALGLAPKGRELDIEAAYGRALFGGWIDANLFVRRDPGNIAALPADKGAAIRYALSF